MAERVRPAALHFSKDLLTAKDTSFLILESTARFFFFFLRRAGRRCRAPSASQRAFPKGGPGGGFGSARTARRRAGGAVRERCRRLRATVSESYRGTAHRKEASKSCVSTRSTRPSSRSLPCSLPLCSSARSPPRVKRHRGSKAHSRPSSLSLYLSRSPPRSLFLSRSLPLAASILLVRKHALCEGVNTMFPPCRSSASSWSAPRPASSASSSASSRRARFARLYNTKII